MEDKPPKSLTDRGTQYDEALDHREAETNEQSTQTTEETKNEGQSKKTETKEIELLKVDQEAQCNYPFNADSMPRRRNDSIEIAIQTDIFHFANESNIISELESDRRNQSFSM